MAIGLAYLAGISLPGDPAKPNEDAFCHAATLAAVFDGATPLCEPILPVDSDAAWIARKGAEGLIAHQQCGAREALRRAAADAEQVFNSLRLRIPRENHELPLASMMMVAAANDHLEFFWFGDCAALVKAPGALVEIIGDAFEKRIAEARRVARLAEREGLDPTAGVTRPGYLDALKAGRNRVNTQPGTWAFSPDANCAAFAASSRPRAVVGTRLLLCTDGFLALASDYGRYDAESFFAACWSRGLRSMCDELRDIELSDPHGRSFPRFKVSDDASALLLEVCTAVDL